jgi:hypothetical protein
VCAYANTENKAAIRRQWDLPILQQWRSKIGRPLTYFGLPGPDIWDFLDWRQVLDSRRTAVESLGYTAKHCAEAANTIGLLQSNVMIHGISSGFQLLRGDVEDVLLNAVDADRNRPQINDGQPAHLARFGYDVVNLDFDGGLGHTDKHGAAKRVRALKKLFERQQGHSFVLLLTINLRDTLGRELETYLKGLQTRDRGPGWTGIIDWYLNRRDGEREYWLKAVVPSFVHVTAELNMFRSTCRPPIFYQGHQRAQLVHFAFELEAQEGSLRSFSAQDDRHLLELPLLRAENGRLQPAPRQPLGFNPENWGAVLAFLPEETRQLILDCQSTVDLPHLAPTETPQ